MKPVIAIHDLSGLGHSSLAVALPVLSVMGHQVLCAPTAVLSSQTDGYSGYSNVDLSEMLPRTLAHWAQTGLSAGAVYSGYLANPGQAADVMTAIDRFLAPDGIALVDPVLGDGGRLYDTMTPELTSAMRELIGHATLITPNATELRALADIPLDAPLPLPALKEAVRHLAALGPRQVIVTSYGEADDRLTTAIYDRASDRLTTHDEPRRPGHYPGTGDLYASVLLGHLLNGRPLETAAIEAGHFVARAIDLAIAAGRPAREGVPFEPLLKEL